MSAKRGLVVSPPVFIEPGNVVKFGGDFDPQEFRFSLLFWDMLDYPANNLVRNDNGGDDADFLIDAGIMKRTPVALPGGGFDRIVIDTHVGGFRLLDKNEPGTWSLAAGERSISFPESDFDAVDRAALVEIHRAIPIPNEDVPLQDVLDFRARRRDELVALRTHLEGVYQRVIAAGDGELAWDGEVEALERAIADHIKVSRESGFKLRWSSFEAGLNLAGGVFAAGMALAQGLPIVGALGVGAAASIALKGGAALKQRAVSATPFRYISRFHEELFPGA